MMDEMMMDEPEATPDLDNEPQAMMQIPDYDSSVNLVEVIAPMPQAEKFPGGEKWLAQLGQTVIQHSNSDFNSASAYRSRRQKHLDLFTGGVNAWTGSQKNIVYIHMPYLTKAILQFHAKLYRNNFPNSGDIAAARVNRPGEAARMKEAKLSRHMNWYLLKRVPEYRDEHDRGGIQLLLHGDAVSVWYYCSPEKRWKFEFCNSDDIRVPYARKAGPPNMSDVPRITWVHRMHRHELEEAGNPDAETGQVYYQNIEKIFDQDYGPTGEATAGKGAVQTPSPSVTATNDQRQGVTPQSDDGDQPRNVLEQDRWLALPGERRLRFVTVTVDEATGLVLRLVRQEIDDVRDRQRYERDIQVVDSEHEANLAQYEAVLPELQMQRDQAAAIARTMIDPATGLFPEGVQAPQIPELPPPPKHPGYNSVRTVKRVPFRRFTHYVCFPNPEGYYGYGLGYLIEGHNMAADEVMTLYTSLLRMNLVPTFFHPRFNNMNQEIKLKLGEGNPLPITAAEMGDKLLQFVQFPQGDANAFKVEERQSTAVQEITADNIISGAPGMSGQTATETDVRAANAMDNIAMIGSRINRARTQEVQTLAHALSQTLDDETFPVDGEGDIEEYMITREDYQDSFDVYVTADPDFASQPQKEARAMKLIGGLGQVPPEAVDPVSFALLWRAALVKLLKATKDEDLVPIVTNAQQPQLPGAPPPEGAEMMPEEGMMPNEESDQGPPPGDGGQPMEPPAGDAGPAQMPQ